MVQINLSSVNTKMSSCANARGILPAPHNRQCLVWLARGGGGGGGGGMGREGREKRDTHVLPGGGEGGNGTPILARGREGRVLLSWLGKAEEERGAPMFWPEVPPFPPVDRHTPVKHSFPILLMRMLIKRLSYY